MKAKKEPFDRNAEKSPQRIDLQWKGNELGSCDVSTAYTLRVSLPPDPRQSESLAFVKKKRTRWHWQCHDVAKLHGRCKKSGTATSKKGAMEAAMRSLDDWLEQLKNGEVTFPNPPKRDLPPYVRCASSLKT